MLVHTQADSVKPTTQHARHQHDLWRLHLYVRSNFLMAGQVGSEPTQDTVALSVHQCHLRLELGTRWVNASVRCRLGLSELVFKCLLNHNFWNMYKMYGFVWIKKRRAFCLTWFNGTPSEIGDVPMKKSSTQMTLHYLGWFCAWVFPGRLKWVTNTAPMIAVSNSYYHKKFGLLDWPTVLKHQCALLRSLLTISFLLPPDGCYWCHSCLEGVGWGTFSTELFSQLPDFIFKYSHRAC